MNDSILLREPVPTAVVEHFQKMVDEGKEKKRRAKVRKEGG